MQRLIATTILGLFLLSGTQSGANEPHPGPLSNDQAEFLFKEAQEARTQNKNELAADHYGKILKRYPTFREILTVYQDLISIHLIRHQWKEASALGKKALHLHPKGSTYMNIQFMRAQAELLMNQNSKAKMIADEILKSKPTPNEEAHALLYKAEALSRMGKHKEAKRSLDGGKSHEFFPDTELKVSARACSDQKAMPKQEPYFYFEQKNLCFKEAAALSKTEPAKDSSQVWCDRFQLLQNEVTTAKIDSFTREKLLKELEMTKGLTATWGCK